MIEVSKTNTCIVIIAHRLCCLNKPWLLILIKEDTFFHSRWAQISSLHHNLITRTQQFESQPIISSAQFVRGMAGSWPHATFFLLLPISLYISHDHRSFLEENNTWLPTADSTPAFWEKYIDLYKFLPTNSKPWCFSFVMILVAHQMTLRCMARLFYHV